jgi:hypothetical protein
MPLRIWTYDLAREQSPNLDHLRLLCRTTQESGFHAIGLYLEHRFAYPSAPWAHGAGCLTPETVRKLQSEFPELQIVPFVNLLGHFEGMLYTEKGKRYREELFSGLQACPSNPAFVELCEKLVDDTLAAFDSELVHIGGDETWQLGACPLCKEKVESGDGDGKARLYGEHFGPLARRVLEAGRRPAVWGDMFADHPGALDFLPQETLIFDWQYFGGVKESARKFLDRGFEVVGCPALHTYNATWLHIPQSEENVRQVAADAAELNLHGVCVTTWECGLFGSYDTLLPALKASGQILQDQQAPSFLAHYLHESERYEEWARLMGVELQDCGGPFAFSGIRSSLKCRLLLYSNPFLAWMHHAEELSGEVGDRALAIFERAFAVAPNEAAIDVTLFARSAVEFVRLAEAARLEYAQGNAEASVGKLAPTRQLFEALEGAAKRTHERIGGSLADLERCRAAKRHVEIAIQRIRQYGDGSLGYLPAFEILTHPKFVPHDQASWWLINRWANQ